MDEALWRAMLHQGTTQYSKMRACSELLKEHFSSCTVSLFDIDETNDNGRAFDCYARCLLLAESERISAISKSIVNCLQQGNIATFISSSNVRLRLTLSICVDLTSEVSAFTQYRPIRSHQYISRCWRLCSQS